VVADLQALEGKLRRSVCQGVQGAHGGASRPRRGALRTPDHLDRIDPGGRNEAHPVSQLLKPAGDAGDVHGFGAVAPNSKVIDDVHERSLPAVWLIAALARRSAAAPAAAERRALVGSARAPAPAP